MPTVRELQVRFIEREVNDPRVGEPITGLDAILRLMSHLRFTVDEEVWAVVLDVERKIVGMYLVSKGGRHEAMLDAASLYRTALLAEASFLIVVHNHPSAGVRPSQADIYGTEGMVMAGIALQLPLIDHVIIGGKAEYSFAQAGMLAFIEAKALKNLGLQGIPDVKHPEEREKEVRDAFALLGKKEAPVEMVPAEATC